MFLEINQLKKSYCSEENRIEVLKGISFCVEKGEICVLLGPSGCGKSTLLNIIGGIDRRLVQVFDRFSVSDSDHWFYFRFFSCR